MQGQAFCPSLGQQGLGACHIARGDQVFVTRKGGAGLHHTRRTRHKAVIGPLQDGIAVIGVLNGLAHAEVFQGFGVHVDGEPCVAGRGGLDQHGICGHGRLDLIDGADRKAGKIIGVRLIGQLRGLIVSDDVEFDFGKGGLFTCPIGVGFQGDFLVLLPCVKQIRAALSGVFGGIAATHGFNGCFADDMAAVIGQGDNQEGGEGLGQVDDAVTGIDDLHFLQLFELIGPGAI